MPHWAQPIRTIERPGQRRCRAIPMGAFVPRRAYRLSAVANLNVRREAVELEAVAGLEAKPL